MSHLRLVHLVSVPVCERVWPSQQFADMTIGVIMLLPFAIVAILLGLLSIDPTNRVRRLIQ